MMEYDRGPLTNAAQRDSICSSLHPKLADNWLTLTTKSNSLYNVDLIFSNKT